MARAYGMDLRRRVIDAIDGGLSARSAAAHFSIGVSTAISWHRQWRDTGTLEPGRQGKPPRSRLDRHEGFIIGLIEERADIALKEITACLAQTRGVYVCVATLWYFLKGRGWTYKKRPPMLPSNSGQTSLSGGSCGSTNRWSWSHTD